jgi:uncharacterized protein (TIGR02996 family)
VTEPVRPFPHVPEIEDDPRISGFLALQDDEAVWYARWSTPLSEYPRSAVTVAVFAEAAPSAVVAQGLAPAPAPIRVHSGQAVADWSDVLPLLREVAEDPGDRDRRLVFADYLDDLGQIYAADSLRVLVAKPALWYSRWWPEAPAMLSAPPPPPAPTVPIEQIRQDFFRTGA